jgi:hypothetical protein
MIWKNEIGGGMWHVRGRGDLLTGFQWANQKETHHLEDQSIDGRQNIKMDIQEIELEAWTVFI